MEDVEYAVRNKSVEEAVRKFAPVKTLEHSTFDGIACGVE